jgi:alpha-N-arabinofuranosidase
MILTPTYHVLEMYKVHQNATSLPITVEAPAYVLGDKSVPSISASASVDAAGRTHVSLANLDPNKAVMVTVNLTGVKATGVTGRILTAPAMDSRNTFETPDAVAPKPFTGAKLAGSTLTAAMPAKSVVVLELN